MGDGLSLQTVEDVIAAGARAWSSKLIKVAISCSIMLFNVNSERRNVRALAHTCQPWGPDHDDRAGLEGVEACFAGLYVIRVGNRLDRLTRHGASGGQGQ